MVAVSVVATSLLLALLTLAEPTPSSHLAVREWNGFGPIIVPAACQVTCKPFTDVVTRNSCTNIDCVCTNTIATGLKTCLRCGVNAKVEGLNQTVADATIKDFMDSCNAAGKTVTISSGTTIGLASGLTSAAGKSGAMALGFSVVGAVVTGALGIFSFTKI